MFRSLRLRATVALTAALLAVAGLAFAQSAPTQPATPATPSSQQQTLAQLQREALRLTLVARLPAADQQQATNLLDRADALRQKAQDLRLQELQAYVDALKSGTAPATARAQAQQKVASQRTSLTQDAATLRSDAQSFLQKVPQARALLAYLRVGGGLGNARGGLLGFGLGSRAPQAGGFAPGYRAAPGMRFDDRGWGRTPDRQGPAAPGWNRPPSRYGRYGQGMRQGMQGPMGRYGGRSYRMGPNGVGRGGYLPWGRPASPNRAPQDNAPQNNAPQNGAPQNSAPQNSAPQNSAPQNTTPPSGNGAGGA